MANDKARHLHAVPSAGAPSGAAPQAGLPPVAGAQVRAANAEALVELYAEAPVPTRRGTLRMLVFRERGTDKEHVAIVKGDVRGEDDVPVRVHSECLTSEIFGSLKCDCREQLDRALDLICASERGVLLYLRQEGRGIGLGNKIRAYALQAHGVDTYDANRALGFPDDLRRYDVAACMLKQLGLQSVALITNNPLKISELKAEGVDVTRRIPSKATLNPHNMGYLETKRVRTGHLIDALGPELTGDEPLPG